MAISIVLFAGSLVYDTSKKQDINKFRHSANKTYICQHGIHFYLICVILAVIFDVFMTRTKCNELT